MTRCSHRLWDDPSALQCVRSADDPGHTHVYEHATHPDPHDRSEQEADPC